MAKIQFSDEFAVDLYSDKYMATRASQYDVNSRQMFIAVSQGGEVVELDGMTAWIKCMTPDSKAIPFACDILMNDEGKYNIVHAVIPDTVLLVPGNADCQIVISNGQEVIDSMHFIIQIVKSVFPADALAENLQYISFENAVSVFAAANQRVATEETKAIASAAEAKQYAEEAAQSADNAADSEKNSETYYLLSKSYAVGNVGTDSDIQNGLFSPIGEYRNHDDTDNAKWYYEHLVDAVNNTTLQINNLKVILGDLDPDYYYVNDPVTNNDTIGEAFAKIDAALINIYNQIEDKMNETVDKPEIRSFFGLDS